MDGAQRKFIGEEQLTKAIHTNLKVENFVGELGIYSLSALIEKVLDEHYPAVAFGDGDALIPTWLGDHNGEDIEPGVRWVALLRHAIKEAFERSA